MPSRCALALLTLAPFVPGCAPAPEPAPERRVLFAPPPTPADPVAPLTTELVAEFAAEGGMVRFVDEGDVVSTVVAGPPALFRRVGRAQTLRDLYLDLAPPGAEVPEAIAAAGEAPAPGLRFVAPKAAGPTTSSVFEVDEDDWAGGCDDGEYDQWIANFEAWHDVLAVSGAGGFAVSDHIEFEPGPAEDVFRYFGKRDEIWFAVCSVSSTSPTVSQVMIQWWDQDWFGGPGAGGEWQTLPAFTAAIDSGQRYLYHNASWYTPFRRARIHPVGEAQFTGFEYFVSAAGRNTSEADETLLNPSLGP
jgi:hypothetical protein